LEASPNPQLILNGFTLRPPIFDVFYAWMIYESKAPLPGSLILSLRILLTRNFRTPASNSRPLATPALLHYIALISLKGYTFKLTNTSAVGNMNNPLTIMSMPLPHSGFKRPPVALLDVLGQAIHLHLP
jgi:hypothetical protein